MVRSRMELAVAAALTAAGLAMLCLGGHWLVSGGVGIAARLGISPLVIGMTVVAYGTSTPELAASLAATGEHGGIILGNVVGSNIANVGMVIGIAAMLAAIPVTRRVLRREIPLMIGFSLLLVVLSAHGGGLSQADGAVLIAALVAFSAHVYVSARRGAPRPPVPAPAPAGSAGAPRGVTAPPPAAAHAPAAAEHAAAEAEAAASVAAGRGRAAGEYARNGALIAAGVALLAGGAWLAIENAVAVAGMFGMSDRLIGITVIAVGTSAPELITSIIAIRRGHADIGVGNIVGSNIYNVLMITGVAAAVSPIAVGEHVYVDYAVMVAFSLALLVALRTKAVRLPFGATLAASYAAYLAFSFLKG